MNDVTYFRKAIWLNPHDKLGVKVFADFLQEYHGYPRWKALRKGAKVRRGRLHTEQLAEASALIAAESTLRGAIGCAIREQCKLNDGATLRLFIVNGSRPPSAELGALFTDGEWVNWFDVRVGARWILATAVELEVVPADFFRGTVVEANGR